MFTQVYLGEDRVFPTQKVEAYTSEDYIQDGLIVQIDAYENAGRGLHENGLSAGYVNLVNGRKFASYFGLSSFCVTDSCISCIRTPSNDFLANLLQNSRQVISSMFCNDHWTMEHCLQGDSAYGSSTHQGFYDNSVSAYGSRLCWFHEENDCIYFYVGNSQNKVTISGIKKDDIHSTSLTKDGLAGKGYYLGNKVFQKDDCQTIVPNLFGGYIYQGARLKSFRLYNRTLSEEEVAYNAHIDDIRFRQSTSNINKKDNVIMLASSMTARSYVQDGLIAQWDGIENIGFGQHSDSTTTWKDLIGNANFISPTSINFSNDSAFIGEQNDYSKYFVVDITKYKNIYNVINLIPFKFTIETILTAKQGFLNSGYDAAAFTYGKQGYTRGFSLFGGLYNKNYVGLNNTVQYLNANVIEGRKNKIIIVADNGIATIYIENQIVRIIDIPGTSIKTNIPRIILGKFYENSTSETWVTNFSAMRFYNRALTPDEIRYNYFIDKARFGLQ